MRKGQEACKNKGEVRKKRRKEEREERRESDTNELGGEGVRSFSFVGEWKKAQRAQETREREKERKKENVGRKRGCGVKEMERGERKGK